MEKSEQLPKRKRNRLQGYDYAQNGMYFVTICARERCNVFWDPEWMKERAQENESDIDLCDSPEPCLSNIGKWIEQAIDGIEVHYPGVYVDKFCIMPEHVHLIVCLDDEDGETLPNVSTVVGQMKRWVSKQSGRPVWQKSFYDQVIQSEQAYQEIWRYIDQNPLGWREDMWERADAIRPYKIAMNDMQ